MATLYLTSTGDETINRLPFPLEETNIVKDGRVMLRYKGMPTIAGWADICEERGNSMKKNKSAEENTNRLIRESILLAIDAIKNDIKEHYGEGDNMTVAVAAKTLTERAAAIKTLTEAYKNIE